MNFNTWQLIYSNFTKAHSRSSRLYYEKGDDVIAEQRRRFSCTDSQIDTQVLLDAVQDHFERQCSVPGGSENCWARPTHKSLGISVYVHSHSHNLRVLRHRKLADCIWRLWKKPVCQLRIRLLVRSYSQKHNVHLDRNRFNFRHHCVEKTLPGPNHALLRAGNNNCHELYSIQLRKLASLPRHVPYRFHFHPHGMLTIRDPTPQEAVSYLG